MPSAQQYPCDISSIRDISKAPNILQYLSLASASWLPPASSSSFSVSSNNSATSVSRLSGWACETGTFCSLDSSETSVTLIAGTVAMLPPSGSLSRLSKDSCLVSELVLGRRWLGWLLPSDVSGNPVGNQPTTYRTYSIKRRCVRWILSIFDESFFKGRPLFQNYIPYISDNN